MRRRLQILLPMFAAAYLCATPVISLAYSLPDTDQRKCYQDVDPYAEIPCDGTGQDGAYIINPMSFTNNSNGTITDNNTGLIWQQNDDGVGYNWYRASGTYDATDNPESADVCGSLDLGGTTDWRLPTKKELMSIVDYAIPLPGPMIQTAYFQNTLATNYWSSTTYAVDSNNAWSIDFNYGYVGGNDKTISIYRVRCVRGGQLPSGPTLIDNGNGTTTDSSTGLDWQSDGSAPQAWGSALTYCEGLDLGGRTDWRLPNIKELGSVTDDTQYGVVERFWSSTTGANDPGSAWSIDFGTGLVIGGAINGIKNSDMLVVHCVRSGQSGRAKNDFDGDCKTDMAVYHQAEGDWYIAYSGGGYNLGYNMGWSATVPVAADYDGDGKTDMAVYHQAAGDWYIVYSSGGYLLDYSMGWSEAIPVPGDYDGDGKTDMAVYHQAAGDWYIAYSGGGYLLDYNMGWSEAYPAGGY